MSCEQKYPQTLCLNLTPPWKKGRNDGWQKETDPQNRYADEFAFILDPIQRNLSYQREAEFDHPSNQPVSIYIHFITKQGKPAFPAEPAS